jgi:hypothetical protein
MLYVLARRTTGSLRLLSSLCLYEMLGDPVHYLLPIEYNVFMPIVP